MIDRAAVRAFLDRPWSQLERATEDHRVESYGRDPEWTRRTADALRAAVVEANPDWPTPADREADLAHHLELRALLDRAAHGLPRLRRPR